MSSRSPALCLSSTSASFTASPSFRPASSGRASSSYSVPETRRKTGILGPPTLRMIWAISRDGRCDPQAPTVFVGALIGEGRALNGTHPRPFELRDLISRHGLGQWEIFCKRRSLGALTLFCQPLVAFVARVPRHHKPRRNGARLSFYMAKLDAGLLSDCTQTRPMDASARSADLSTISNPEAAVPPLLQSEGDEGKRGGYRVAVE